MKRDAVGVPDFTTPSPGDADAPNVGQGQYRDGHQVRHTGDSSVRHGNPSGDDNVDNRANERAPR
jgi:hypothetical protein